MAIHDFFSFRRDRASASWAGQTDVYAYDKLPEVLLGQIVHIWGDCLNVNHSYQLDGSRMVGGLEIWKAIERIFWREYGMLGWPDYKDSFEPSKSVQIFFLNGADNDQRLNLIELSFSFVARFGAEHRRYIDELNERFKRASIGYQFDSGQLIRMDSTIAHEEIIKPALVLLGRRGFEEADKQFRLAYSHYRKGEYPQVVTEAGRAFESALKAICMAKMWAYPTGARATDLVKVAVRNGFFPEWLGSGLTAYVAMMNTGLPTVRNEAASHGTAPNAEPVHDYMARYALHMAASNILMVADAANHRPKI